MAIDRNKAYEISDNGLLLEGGSHFSSGNGVPTHSGLKGDLYLNTANFSMYRLAIDGTTWGLVSGEEIFFNNVGLKFNSTNVFDSIKEVQQNNVSSLDILTTSNNGNYQISENNSYVHDVQGSATGYSVTLPNAQNIFLGKRIEISNNSSNTIQVKDFQGAVLANLVSGDLAVFTLETQDTTAGTWILSVVSGSATGIISYVVTSNTAFSTSSITDIVITNFSTTPVSGRYSLYFSSDLQITANNAIFESVAYVDGAEVSNTRRSVQGVSSNFVAQAQSIGEVSVNGSQVVDIRVNISTNSVSVNQRSLILVRLGS